MRDRRAVLKLFAAAGAAAGLKMSAAAGQAAGMPAPALSQPQAPAPAAGAGIRKSTLVSMLPKAPTYLERFKVAREAGFDAIEMRTITRPEEAAEIGEAARTAGLRIHSVMNEAHWRLPLSSSDPDVVTRSVEGMETSIRNAVLWGADAVLLVPAVVDANTGYKDAWERSQRVIRERLVPVARDAKIVIAIEEVWNKFLLSPLEFARYVDELDSPFVRAYFDVGNILIWAFPQDWIRTLGPRIVKVHVKDFLFDRKNGRYAWKNLGEGEIDWQEVRRALDEVKFAGYVTTELPDGDAAYLKDVSARVDRFLAGQKPVG